MDSSISTTLLENITETGLTAESSEFEFEFYTEVSPNAESNVSREKRYLAGISRRGEPFQVEQASETDSFADGKVLLKKGDKPVAEFIVEVKSGDDGLSMGQLNRYREQFDTPEANCTSCRWGQVYGTLRRGADTTEVCPDKFLLEQYADFLRNEELEGILAEDKKFSKETGELTVINRVLIRYNQPKEQYEIRYWSRDWEDGQRTSTSMWFTESTYKDLFEQIPRSVRDESFVGDSKNEPEYERFLKWATDERLGQQDEDFVGNNSKVVAEVQGPNGHYPEIRIKDGNSIRFSRLSEKGGAVQRPPAHYGPGEFLPLCLNIDEVSAREALFTDIDFEELWKYYINRRT